MAFDYIPPGKTPDDMVRERSEFIKAVKNGAVEMDEGSRTALMFGQSMERASGGLSPVEIGAPVKVNDMIQSEKYRDVLAEQIGG